MIYFVTTKLSSRVLWQIALRFVSKRVAFYGKTRGDLIQNAGRFDTKRIENVWLYRKEYVSLQRKQNSKSDGKESNHRERTQLQRRAQHGDYQPDSPRNQGREGR
jgi:hypothetical protein